MVVAVWQLREVAAWVETPETIAGLMMDTWVKTDIMKCIDRYGKDGIRSDSSDSTCTATQIENLWTVIIRFANVGLRTKRITESFNVYKNAHGSNVK